MVNRRSIAGENRENVQSSLPPAAGARLQLVKDEVHCAVSGRVADRRSYQYAFWPRITSIAVRKMI